MTTYNKSTLKTFFQTADVPTGTDYANLIDSYVNIVETSTQTMAGPLSVTELIAPLVSASIINASLVSAATFIADTLDVRSINVSGVNVGDVAASSLNVAGAAAVNGAFATFGTNTFAGPNNCSGPLNANAGFTINASPYEILDISIVSAAGTVQATATSIGVDAIVRLQGAVDGSTTGFKLTRTLGLYQTVYNESAVSANLWPSVGCKINGLAANAAFGMVATTPYIVHQYAASAAMVK